jgi:hypothetical protein
VSSHRPFGRRHFGPSSPVWRSLLAKPCINWTP